MAEVSFSHKWLISFSGGSFITDAVCNGYNKRPPWYHVIVNVCYVFFFFFFFFTTTSLT